MKINSIETSPNRVYLASVLRTSAQIPRFTRNFRYAQPISAHWGQGKEESDEEANFVICFFKITNLLLQSSVKNNTIISMIKNPCLYLNSQKKERQRFLSSLTYEESVRILEMLLLSQLARELSFSDHHPASLKKTFENARKQS
jgi:hypothetical protein